MDSTEQDTHDYYNVASGTDSRDLGSSSVQPTFIDLFSGCGGLSLGLMKAGWQGLFAIEQSPDAFNTLKGNLVDQKEHNVGRPRFNWPEEIEVGPHEIASFLRKHRRYLQSIRGKVDLVAGGPPCQGFSFAGKRRLKDPRNELFRYQLRIVDILEPELVLIENVQGIDIALGSSSKQNGEKRGRPRKSHGNRIYEMLHEHGYDVQQHVIRAVDFGVPQLRSRYFTLGIRKNDPIQQECPNFEKELYRSREAFLRRQGLSSKKPVTVLEAISDLATCGKHLAPCRDKESRSGFTEIVYEGPLTDYQRLMHGDMNGQAPNSLRLVNHRPEIIARFKKILATCRKSVRLTEKQRAQLGITKHSIIPLSMDQPSHTLTTLPDDLLHYSEPRIHTVREHARLQSFPDWFEFHGKYTTGGNRRKQECPRYTQVGNAVPPLLAEALGEVLLNLVKEQSRDYELRMTRIDNNRVEYNNDASRNDER